MEIKIIKTDKKEDLEACANLFTINDPWKGLGETYEYNLAKVSSKEEEVYVAKDGEKIVGCLLLEMNSTLKAFVRGLVVAREYRCQRIGAKLLAHIEERVFKEEDNVFIFCDTDRGIKFYKRNGYEEIGVIKNMHKVGVHETILRKIKTA